MTIEQLETFSNTKPELRYLTEEIIKYLQANPGGGGGGLPYSVFTALMNQSATPTDPAVDILQNTFNAPIVWARLEAGVFIGTLAGAFTYLVFMMAGLGQMPEGSTLKYGYSDDNTVFIETYDENGNTVDGLLNNVPIEIRVYS